MGKHFFRKGYETGIILIIITLIVLLIPPSPSVMNVNGVWPSPGILYKGDTGVSLTFNVELGNESIVWLVKDLEEKGINKATFFLDPAWVDRQKEVVEDIQLAGFDIGIYDLHPSRYESLEEKEIAEHLEDLRALFKEHNLDPAYYRTKDELLPPSVVKVMAKYDFIVVSHQLEEKDLVSSKRIPLEGAVVELNADNKLEDMKKNWTKWHDAIQSQEKEVPFVSLLELLASSDSKIKLLD
ncbi:polysaccharide deacetylase family protein [Jeotgalibacillus proteolyticus]|uniref:polysaccharide deacetylase family protein n=1 Tax=Jeotgalibacillus proteolyticus TaxID=2082395 RepID=UPI003CEE38B6